MAKAKKATKAAACGRTETAKTASTCHGCRKTIAVGDKAIGRRFRYHASCR